jgi:N-acetylmuramoyl-L-alanine amidase
VSNEALPKLRKAGRAARIVLDPGHGMGGGENGAVGPTGGSEEEVVLAVAKFATEYLAGVGVEVELTRTNDVATALSSRVEVAKKFKADAFISIHCNAFTAPTAEGVETIYPAPGGPSKALANVLNQAILKAAGPGHRDRGIKMSPSPEYPRRLYVLSNAVSPAVLVELEFISHPAHEKWLVQTETQKSLGFALARGVLQWLKSQPDVTDDSPQQQLA